MESQAYNLWWLVILNAAIFVIFAFSFTKPRTKRDWRSLGAFSAFILALFTEMYGFPLTIYLLSGWLSSRFPGMDLYSHNMGHLWQTVFNLPGDPHLNLLHILSITAIFGGFWILASAWSVLYKAQRAGMLATTGLYAKVRHPQYVGFVLIMIGFLLQWPTIPTLILFPLLVYMYDKLAKTEEKEMLSQFGRVYKTYAASVSAFWPGGRSAA
ncbi:isoprenylcysteine carboxylmethyltransferase family protein [Candidatus Saccharibacteria bacterium]|nr:isoprenylcysteine carboxylmethyltransferase family protein [Candidatus Saccharibacteria bacterium]